MLWVWCWYAYLTNNEKTDDQRQRVKGWSEYDEEEDQKSSKEQEREQNNQILNVKRQDRKPTSTDCGYGPAMTTANDE